MVERKHLRVGCFRLLIVHCCIFITALLSSFAGNAQTAGALDSSFADDGVLSTSVLTEKRNIKEQANAIVTDANGNLVVVGRNQKELFGYWGSAFIARFTANGALDTSFGQNGAIQFPFGYVFNDVKIDSQGRILVSGYEFVERSDNCYDSQLMLLRLNADGSYDNTFAGSGVFNAMQMDCLFYLSETAAGEALVIDSEDNIYTNALQKGDNGFDSVLLKIKSNGLMDSNYGINGIALTGLSHELWSDLNIRLALSSGKLLLAANLDGEFSQQGELKLKQFLANGILDDTFGIEGTATAKTQDYDANLDQLLVDGNGQILLLEHEGFAQASVYLYRFNAQGQLEGSFGSDGKVAVNVPSVLGSDVAVLDAKAALSSNDSVVLAFFGDYFGKPIAPMAVTRIDHNGLLDTSFGSGGSALADKAGYVTGARALSINAAGDIQVAGYINDESNNTTDLLLTKFSAAGNLVSDFGDAGFSISNISNDELSASVDALNTTLYLADGRTLHVGTTVSTNNDVESGQVLVTVVDDQGILDSSFGQDGMALFSLSHIPRSVRAYLDSNQKVVIVAAGEKKATVMRLLSGGQLDSSFAASGSLILGFAYDVQVADVIAFNNKTVAVIEQYQVAGQTDGNSQLAKLVAITAQGTLDTDFGQGGSVLLSSYQTYGLFSTEPDVLSVIGSDYQQIVTEHFNAQGDVDGRYIATGMATAKPLDHVGLSDFSSWQMRAAALDLNGNIWVAVNAANGFGSGSNLLLRLNRAGGLDPRFVESLGDTESELLSEHVGHLSVDLSGQILVTQQKGILQEGLSGFYGSNLIRLTKLGQLDSTFGLNGKSDGLDTKVFATTISPQGKIMLSGARPDGEAIRTSSTVLEPVNFAVARMHYGLPQINAQQSLHLTLEQSRVKTISAAELQLPSSAKILTLVSSVNSGSLFNDINGNDQPDGSIEQLRQGETISRTDINSGRLKFLPNGAQSAFFEFKAGSSADAQVVLLQINPQPNPVLYPPTQSALTDVNPVVAVDFGELVNGFGAEDISVSNGTLQSVVFDGYQYLLTIVPSSNLANGGQIGVSLVAGAATDLLGAASSAVNTSFQWTSYLPVTISEPSKTQTGIESVSFDVAFSSVVNFELSKDEVQLHSDGDITGMVSVSNGKTLNPTVTVEGISGNGSFYIVIVQGAGRGADGRVTQARQSQTVKVVNVAPTLSIKLDGASRTVHGPASYSIRFENAASVNLTAQMVQLLSDDGVSASVAVSGGDTLTPTVTLKGFRGEGFIGIALPSGVATSESGLPSNADDSPYSLRILPNTAPSIAGNPATSVKAGDSYSFTPTASDVDGVEGLSFSIGNKPSWASFDGSSGSLSGTPNDSNGATYSNISISVTDPRGDSASLAAFNIEVVASGGGNGGGGDSGGGSDGSNGGGSGSSTTDGEALIPIIIMLLEEKKKSKDAKNIDN